MTAMRDMPHTLTLTSAPATEPLTAEEARKHCRIEDAAEDTYVESLIEAARRYCENFTNRAFITQTWKLYLDSFPLEIELRRCPVISISSITYVASDGTTTTLATSVYQLLAGTEPGIVTLKYNQTWPSIRGDVQGIVVTFTAGYGAASAVPDTIKHAMKLLIGHWYRNREAVLTGETSKDIEFAVESLLWSERWGAYS